MIGERLKALEVGHNGTTQIAHSAAKPVRWCLETGGNGGGDDMSSEHKKRTIRLGNKGGARLLRQYQILQMEGSV